MPKYFFPIAIEKKATKRVPLQVPETESQEIVGWEIEKNLEKGEVTYSLEAHAGEISDESHRAHDGKLGFKAQAAEVLDLGIEANFSYEAKQFIRAKSDHYTLYFTVTSVRRGSVLRGSYGRGTVTLVVCTQPKQALVFAQAHAASAAQDEGNTDHGLAPLVSPMPAAALIPPPSQMIVKVVASKEADVEGIVEQKDIHLDPALPQLARGDALEITAVSGGAVKKGGRVTQQNIVVGRSLEQCAEEDDQGVAWEVPDLR